MSEEGTSESQESCCGGFGAPLVKVEVLASEGGSIDSQASVEIQGAAALQLQLRFRDGDMHLAPLFSGAEWAGTCVWPASQLLAGFLAEHESSLLQRGGTVLELGKVEAHRFDFFPT